MTSVDIDIHDVVLRLNSMLAMDPTLVLHLVKNRPDVNDDLKELMCMKGNRMSFLGILNDMFKDTGYMIGANCEVEDGEMIYVMFFHVLERKKRNA